MGAMQSGVGVLCSKEANILQGRGSNIARSMQGKECSVILGATLAMASFQYFCYSNCTLNFRTDRV